MPEFSKNVKTGFKRRWKFHDKDTTYQAIITHYQQNPASVYLISNSILEIPGPYAKYFQSKKKAPERR